MVYPERMWACPGGVEEVQRQDEEVTVAGQRYISAAEVAA